MPNFADTRYGVVTRISIHRSGPERLSGLVTRGVHVDALKVGYDHAPWVERFLASWPPGSPAHDSYFRRIAEGPRFALAVAPA